jgi:nucleotide-binding universal stress UspA family protein
MISITRILVPVDLSELSERALAYAVELAEKFAAQLTILYVVAEPASVLPDMMMPVPVAGADLDDLTAAGRQSLAELIAAKGLGRLNPRADVRAGSAEEEILEAAADTHADLIVIGTHGRGGLAHLFLGSVAEKVIRSAPCPVLTLRG